MSTKPKTCGIRRNSTYCSVIILDRQFLFISPYLRVIFSAILYIHLHEEKLSHNKLFHCLRILLAK